VTTAESCTGGWVAKAITDIAGSSAWFERGFVTYSNEAKSQMIGVREATLEQHGAVSEPVVIEMAIGALGGAGRLFPLAASRAGRRQRREACRHRLVWVCHLEREGITRRECFSGDRESGASSGNGLCVKNALATISTKHLILYDHTV
jgi:nicotinamide-nucleotide amidase